MILRGKVSGVDLTIVQYSRVRFQLSLQAHIYFKNAIIMFSQSIYIMSLALVHIQRGDSPMLR